MATSTYNMTLDEALAKRFEKIMADVHEVAVSEDYATDMFLFLREVVIPDFKKFLADGGYAITKIVRTCCDDGCTDCESEMTPTRACGACTTGCPCIEGKTDAVTD